MSSALGLNHVLYSAEANMGSINDEQTNKTLPFEIKIKDIVLPSCPWPWVGW